MKIGRYRIKNKYRKVGTQFFRFGLTAEDCGCMYRSVLSPSKSLALEIATDIAPFQAFPVSFCLHHWSDDSNMATQGLLSNSDVSFDCVREALSVMNGTLLPANAEIAEDLRVWKGKIHPSIVHIYLSADLLGTRAAGTSLLGS